MEKIEIFIGTLGMDQHELGAIAVASLLRDGGMEVLYMGRFNLPPTIVKVCIKEQSADIPVVVGSVITPGDRNRLEEMGIASVFGPGVLGEQIVETIRRIG